MFSWKTQKEKWYSEWVENNVPDLSEKVVAITGTTSGLGYFTAVAAVRKNAKCILLLNRDSERVAKSVALLEEEKSNASAKTEFKTIPCDMQSFESVRAAAKSVNDIAEQLGGLDVLCNNAGIAFAPEGTTVDGFESQSQTNHLSHFLLVSLVLSSLKLAGKTRGEARFVTHTSMSRVMSKFDHKFFMPHKENSLGGNGWWGLVKRYVETKLAVFMFAIEFNERAKATGCTTVKAICADPGLSTTDIVSTWSVDKSQKKFGFKAFIKFYNFSANTYSKKQSAEDGSLPMIMGAFGKDVNGGDVYIPKNESRGVPKKIVSEGVLVKGSKKEAALNKADREKLWEVSVEATKADFDFSG